MKKTKVEIKNIEHFLFICVDPERKGELRHIWTGDPEMIFNMVIQMFPYFVNRLQKLMGKEFDDPQKFIDYVAEHDTFGMPNNPYIGTNESIKADITIDLSVKGKIAKRGRKAND